MPAARIIVLKFFITLKKYSHLIGRIAIDFSHYDFAYNDLPETFSTAAPARPNTQTIERSLAAQPGLEPGIADPNSAVLPITPPGNNHLLKIKIVYLISWIFHPLCHAEW